MSNLFEQKKFEHYNLPDVVKRGVFTLQKVIVDYGKVCNFARSRTHGSQPEFNHTNIRKLENIFKEILMLVNQHQGNAKQRRYRKRKLSTLKYSSTGVIGMEPSLGVPNKVQTLLKGLDPVSVNQGVLQGINSLGDDLVLVKQPICDLNNQVQISCDTTELFHNPKDLSIDWSIEKIYLDHTEIKPFRFQDTNPESHDLKDLSVDWSTEKSFIDHTEIAPKCINDLQTLVDQKTREYEDDLTNRFNYFNSLNQVDYGDNPNDPNNQAQGVDILSFLPSFIEEAERNNSHGSSFKKKKKKKKRKKQQQPPRKPFPVSQREKDPLWDLLDELSSGSEIEPSQSKVLPPELYYLRSWNTPSVFQGKSFLKGKQIIVFSSQEELDNYIKYLVPAVSFIADYKSDMMSDIVFGFDHKLIKSYKDCGLSDLSILTMTVHTRFVEEILIPLHRMANVRH